MKGESAPSLAGGGLRGINLAVPGLANKFMKAVFKKLNDLGLEPGAKVPDVYGEIRGANKKKIVVVAEENSSRRKEPRRVSYQDLIIIWFF